MVPFKYSRAFREIGRKYGRSHNTIKEVVEKFQTQGSTARKPGSGGKKLTSDSMQRRCEAVIKANGYPTKY